MNRRKIACLRDFIRLGNGYSQYFQYNAKEKHFVIADI